MSEQLIKVYIQEIEKIAADKEARAAHIRQQLRVIELNIFTDGDRAMVERDLRELRNNLYKTKGVKK